MEMIYFGRYNDDAGTNKRVVVYHGNINMIWQRRIFLFFLFFFHLHLLLLLLLLLLLFFFFSISPRPLCRLLVAISMQMPK